MEAIGKIAAIAVICVILCVLLKQSNQPAAIVLSIIACIGILLIGMRFLEPIFALAKEIRSISGLTNPMIEPLLKVVGISLVTNMAATVCADAGETALAKAAETSGTILAIYTSIPLILASLELIEKLMGGMQ